MKVDVSNESFAISASAGSGKTFALTKLLLEFLLHEIPVHEILAITFTNKAANEIKDRILKNLRDYKGAGEIQEIIKNGDINEIETKLELLKKRLITHFSTFKVSTIDSFFSSVIKKFPPETGIAVDLNIVDEDEKIPVLEEAYEHFFAQLNKDENTLNRITSLIKSTTERSELKIDSFIKSVFKNINSISYKINEDIKTYNLENIEKDINTWYKYFKSESFLEIIREILKDIEKYLRIANVSPGKLQYFIKKLENYLEQKDLKQLINISPFKKIKPLNYIQAIINRNREIGEKIQNNILKVKKKLEDFIIQEMNYKIYTKIDIFLKIKKEYDELKRQKGIMDFEDIELKARDFLLKLKDFKYFSYRFDSPINYIFLDEFQDTSELQWEAIEPVVKNALERKGAFYYVGDVKQSIYQWRGGTPELFNKIKEKYNLKEKTLEYNYRSAPNIIEFVNKIFKKISEEYPFFKYSEQKPGEDNIKRAGKGYIYIKKYSNSHKNKKLIYDEVINEIKKLKEDITLNNIAVLCRTRSEITEIELRLAREGIPFVASGSRSLLDNFAVNDIVNFLKFIENPLEKIHLVEVLRSNIFRLDYNEIEKILLNGSKNIIENLPEDIKTPINKILSKGINQPASKTIKDIIEMFPVYEIYKNDNYEMIMELYEHAKIFEHKNKETTLHDFITYIKNYGNSIKTSTKSINGVILNTIHSAKGLEYHTVILPFLDKEKLNKNPIYILTDEKTGKPVPVIDTGKYIEHLSDNEIYKNIIKKLNEQKKHEWINLLYVGLTRAKSNLIIFPAVPDKGENPAKILVNSLQNTDKSFWDKIEKNEIFIKDEVVTEKEKTKTEKRTWKIDFNYPEIKKQETIYQKIKPRYNLELGDRLRTSILKGLVIHNVLKNIQHLYSDKSLIERYIDRALSFEGQNHTKAEKEIVKNDAIKTIIRILEDERLSSFFTDNSYTEVTTIGKEYDSLIGRIDRLTIEDKLVKVLDFKTDTISNKDEITNHIDKYKKQIQDYCKTMKNIYPDKKVEGYIYFTEAEYPDRIQKIYNI